MNFTKENTAQAIGSILAIFVALLTSSNLMSQNDSFNFENEISIRNQVASTPEAAAFAKYGDVDVNMYTGTPNISVPIYTHKGRELDLPISLSYDASGIKVNQLPGTVGLGWSLNVGGRISRMVNGLPDDYVSLGNGVQPYHSWYNPTIKGKMDEYVKNGYAFGYRMAGSKTFGTEQLAEDYLHFLNQVHTQEYETQPDYYNLSVMGLNETFVLDLASKTPYSLNNPNTKISRNVGTVSEASLGGVQTFTVTSENGTVYTFAAVEQTQLRKMTDNGISNWEFGRNVTFTSSWYLTKIVSPTGKDTYTFEYQSYTNNRTQDYSTGTSEAVTVVHDEFNDRTTSIQYATTQTNFWNLKVLSKITHNQKVILDATVVSSILNGPDAGITDINIYNDGNLNSGTDLSKSYHFNYDYFKAGAGVQISLAQKDRLRLKLDAIDIKDQNNQHEQSYSFDYIDENNIAELGTWGQDYLGYYNGFDDNQYLYVTSTTSETRYPKSKGMDFPSNNGGKRSPLFAYAERGLLYKITYPTGGTTTFGYEQAHVNKVEIEYDTQLTTRVDLSHSTASLPADDSNQCNASDLAAPSNIYTPDVATAIFTIPYDSNGSDNRNTITYTPSGTSTIQGVHYIPKQVVIVKIQDASSPYTWAQIYDGNCELLIDPSDVVWTHDDPYATSATVYLSHATAYQVLLPIFDIGISKNIKIEGYNQIAVSNVTTLPRAGLRVAVTNDYSNGGVLAKKKEFDYLDPIALTDPIFEYITNEMYQESASNGPQGQNPAQSRDYQVLHRVSQPINGGGLHIAYSSVRERLVDVSNPTNNITKTHNFKRPTITESYYNKGVYQQRLGAGGHYVGNGYSKEPSLGSMIGSSTTNTLNSSTLFPRTYHYDTWGLTLGVRGENNDLFPIIDDSNGTIRISLVAGDIPGTLYSGFGTVYAIPPSACGNPEYCTPEISRLFLHKTRAYGYHGSNVRQSTSTTDGVKTVNTYMYTSGDKRYLKKSIATLSTGEIMTTIYDYPHELYQLNEEAGNGYDDLVQDNMLSQPVVIRSYEGSPSVLDQELLSTVKTTYTNQSLPKEIFTSKGMNDLELRMEFEQYEGGNVVQAKEENGRPISFIWGYDNRYIVAKIANVEYNDLSTPLINQIQSTTDESQLRLHLDSLRASLTNAQMTSYTFKPNIGVSTITDASGYYMKYHYDDFQRLKRVEDQDGNVISENEYRYKN